MKFNLLIQIEGKAPHWEKYDSADIFKVTDLSEEEDIERIEQWSAETLERFNATLKPFEKPRKLIWIDFDEKPLAGDLIREIDKRLGDLMEMDIPDYAYDHVRRMMRYIDKNKRIE